MSRVSERKLAQRHAHAVGLDTRSTDGVSADDRRKATAAERKEHRPPRAKPKLRPRWSELIGAGGEVMERMVSQTRKAKAKPDKPGLIAVLCDCHPPRDHGPHWVTPTADEQAALKEAA